MRPGLGPERCPAITNRRAHSSCAVSRQADAERPQTEPLRHEWQRLSPTVARPPQHPHRDEALRALGMTQMPRKSLVRRSSAAGCRRLTARGLGAANVESSVHAVRGAREHVLTCLPMALVARTTPQCGHSGQGLFLPVGGLRPRRTPMDAVFVCIMAPSWAIGCGDWRRRSGSVARVRLTCSAAGRAEPSSHTSARSRFVTPAPKYFSGGARFGDFCRHRSSCVKSRFVRQADARQPSPRFMALSWAGGPACAAKRGREEPGCPARRSCGLNPLPITTFRTRFVTIV